MGYKAYLQRGTAKLDLDTSPYDIAFGFVPPAVTETPNIGTGTSANQYGGGKLISKRTEPGAYSFSVRVMGSSNAHNEALVDRLDRFIRSGTEAEPVYFCWRPADNVDCEPLYGQWNATRRAKVITGSVYKSAAYYGVYSVRDTVIFADVNMIINPPEGKRQRVATATGGVIEDTIGTTDGTSRGMIVAEATVNQITNPIFGHATPLNDWITGADIISEVVTDGDYVLFGDNSVRLTKLAAGSVYSFSQSYTAAGTATHCLSFYAKKSDGSAVTASDIRPRYSATIPTDATYTPVGNGWYRVYDTFAGIASAEITGCQLVTTGTTVYVDGFQFEQKAYPTPLAYGDQMGCVWASTAHDSATTRTAGSLKIPAADCIQPSNFTWWIAFRANTSFADHPSSVYLLEEATTTANIRAGTTGQIIFSDGTNTANGAVTAITVGQIVIVHATMDSAGMKLYRNGAQDGATQSTFVPVESSTFLHLGTYSNTGGPLNATILGAGTYNRALTAAEIALDYANMLQAARGMDGYGGRVDWIPYLWTKDGDNVVDQYQDSTHNNWCVVASIPGSMPNRTEMYLTSSVEHDETSGPAGLLMSGFDISYKDVFSPAALFSDLSGTAIADTVGGQAERLTVDVTPPDGAYLTLDRNSAKLLDGKNIRILMRAYDSGASASMLIYHNYSQNVVTEYLPVATDNQFENMISPTAITLPKFGSYLPEIASFPTAQVGFNLIRHTVSANTDFDVDWFQIITRPIMVITVDGSAGEDQVIYSSDRTDVINIDSSTGALGSSQHSTHVLGDRIELLPNRSNYLFSLLGTPINYNSGLAQQAITLTMTYTKTYITPRWALA